MRGGEEVVFLFARLSIKWEKRLKLLEIEGHICLILRLRKTQ